MKRAITNLPAVLLLAAAAVLFPGCLAQDGLAQATYYNSINHGYCGFFDNIPANGFVAAWPFIETGPNGQGFAQPGADGQGCGTCFEVSCVPQFVESADGSIYLDRRDACAEPNRAVVVQIVDECRCSLPQDSSLPKGNFNWCCNTPTPRLGVNRHIDLSQQAFSALVKDGNFGLGIIGIRYRRTPCSRLGVVRIDGSNSTAMLPTTVVPAVSATAASGSAGASSPQRPSSGTVTSTTATNVAASASSGSAAELPLLSQCGGMGAKCADYTACVDAPFPGRTCPTGASCVRQNKWYWQCMQQQGASSTTKTIASDTSKPAGSASPANPTPQRPAASGSSATTTNYNNNANAASRPVDSNSNNNKVLRLVEQCGGKGARCAEYSGSCADKPFPGFTCDRGLTCVRQNEWFYMCEKQTSRGSNNHNSAASAAAAPTNPKPSSTATRPQANPNENRPQQPTNTASTAGSSTTTATATAAPLSPRKVLAAGEQCGGLGGNCSSLGGCADAALPALKCGPGLSCTKQNQWDWECRA